MLRFCNKIEAEPGRAVRGLSAGSETVVGLFCQTAFRKRGGRWGGCAAREGADSVYFAKEACAARPGPKGQDIILRGTIAQ